MTTRQTMRAGRKCAHLSSVASDPFRDPFDAPFTLLTRPPGGPCSGDFRLNWDGTPAHSSGAWGGDTGQALAGRWAHSGGVA